MRRPFSGRRRGADPGSEASLLAAAAEPAAPTDPEASAAATPPPTSTPPEAEPVDPTGPASDPVPPATATATSPGEPDDRLPDSEPEQRGPAAYVAELLGTFALVFLITAAVSLFVLPPQPSAPGLPPTQPFIDFSVIGLVHVFVLFLLIQTLAGISGAHFNPAVTLALAAIRRIGPVDALFYLVAQLAGAIAGAFLTKALLLDEGEGIKYGALFVNDRIDEAILPGMVVEGLGTFFLVFAIVGVAVNPTAVKEWAGLTIGATLGLIVMVFAPLTGAGFNPARAFGPALAAGDFGGADQFLLVYVLAPVIGAVLAAYLYLTLFIAPGKKEPGGMQPVG